METKRETTSMPKINNSKYYRIKAAIINNQIIHKRGINKDYVEYDLRIITDYGKWTIKKRYRDFLILNKTLKNIFPKTKKIFPCKSLFKTSRKTIHERISGFNEYLNYILNKINIFLYREIINFILLDKEILDLFIKKYKMLQIDENNLTLISMQSMYENLEIKDNIKTSHRKRGGVIDDSINNINIFEIDNYYESILLYAKKKKS